MFSLNPAARVSFAEGAMLVRGSSAEGLSDADF
jgi:hypothetical protein